MLGGRRAKRARCCASRLSSRRWRRLRRPRASSSTTRRTGMSCSSAGSSPTSRTSSPRTPRTRWAPAASCSTIVVGCWSCASTARTPMATAFPARSGSCPAECSTPESLSHKVRAERSTRRLVLRPASVRSSAFGTGTDSRGARVTCTSSRDCTRVPPRSGCRRMRLPIAPGCLSRNLYERRITRSSLPSANVYTASQNKDLRMGIRQRPR
mmetsp:Transcript_26538/g.55756  ORF Transcript_26538/g.55756 Transcript_26538/m.55756 type:complete len:211 (+) Transcript_26538:620-1252(+)